MIATLPSEFDLRQKPKREPVGQKCTGCHAELPEGQRQCCPPARVKVCGL